MNMVQVFDFHIEDFLFDQDVGQSIQKALPSLYKFPTVYIIYSVDKSLAYIGESTNIPNRMKNHLVNPDKKRLSSVKIISSPYFNKSAALDIESNMIKYMAADGKFKLLNNNDGISNHLYYQKDEYFKVFEQIWEELRFRKMARKNLLAIENSNLFKYSPFKALSEDQYNSIKEYFRAILISDKKTSFFEGSAGTGKTILAVYLIKLLMTDFEADDAKEFEEISELILLAQQIKEHIRSGNQLKIALVVPMSSLRKSLRNVFKSINGLNANMVIGPSDVPNNEYDLLVVDEAHRLRQRKNLGPYFSQFDKNNQLLGFDKEIGTELDWMIKKSRFQIFFYDEKQSIRPSDVAKERFSQLKHNALTFQLKSQMRVQGGEDYISFVNDLLNSTANLHPWTSEKYELKLFTSMKEMVQALEQKEIEHGLCRTISGYSWEWKSKNNPSTPDVTIDGVDLYWNRSAQDWINTTTDVCEMGCIHTTQGYDLNFAGVIFGSEITFNEESKKIEIISENYYDRSGKAGIHEIDLKEYILNIYKTIMYRGIKGTYVYCYDKRLLDYFKQFIPVST